MKILDRFFLFAKREEQVTLEHIEGAVADVLEAKAAVEQAVENAVETVKQHNAQALETIHALATEIAATQGRIDAANQHLADLGDEFTASANAISAKASAQPDPPAA